MFLKILFNSTHRAIVISILILTFSCKTAKEEYFIQAVETPTGYTIEPKTELLVGVLPRSRLMLWWGDALTRNDYDVADLTLNIFLQLMVSELGLSSALYTEHLSLPLGVHIGAGAIIEERQRPVSKIRMGIYR